MDELNRRMINDRYFISGLFTNKYLPIISSFSSLVLTSGSWRWRRLCNGSQSHRLTNKWITSSMAGDAIRSCHERPATCLINVPYPSNIPMRTSLTRDTWRHAASALRSKWCIICCTFSRFVRSYYSFAFVSDSLFVAGAPTY